MEIRAGYDLIYRFPAPTPILLMLSVRPERQADLITPDLMRLDPSVPVRRYLDSFGNLCTRLLAPAGELRIAADFRIADSGDPEPVAPDACQHPVDELPDEAMRFLLPSRYCESDALSDEAWRLFGGVEPGWARAQAITAYVHEHLTFGYAHARNTRTAAQALDERVGVCRDFAHTAVALCRAMNIPARYCSGYLGDIGVPVVGAMDFSAWFEVYLGGRWITLDARHNKPRIGRIVITRGRDAADTAISVSFGPHELAKFEVICEEVVSG
ncbi:MAG TPA: transglutaminase family protein [Caulobacteraceae bacterium]|jgi:transglutaminase-like putative cysteine protease|nr:transglutaminase family protein [Caulobacteraceae bacterium]